MTSPPAPIEAAGTIGKDAFDTVEEAESATALYGQLLCSLIGRLADRQLLEGSDLEALARTVERFGQEDEHVPEVVGRHAIVLAAFLRTLRP